MKHLREVLAACTLEQDGLVTRAQLAAAGVDAEIADRRIARGLWSRLAPGVFATESGAVTRRQRLRAALLHAGSGSMLAGAAACEMWGLVDVPSCGAVDVLVPHTRRRKDVPGIRVRRTEHIPTAVMREELPVAPVALAALQAARWCGDLRDARAVLCAVVNSRLATVEQLVELLTCSGRRGSAVVRQAVTDLVWGARSAPEAEACHLLLPEARAGRFPPFLLNPEIRLQGRLLGVVDLWVPGVGVGHETDSRRHHGRADDLDATFDRHGGFEKNKLLLLHTSPARMRRAPRDFVGRLVSAAAAPRPEPPGLTVTPRGPLLPLPLDTPAVGWQEPINGRLAS